MAEWNVLLISNLGQVNTTIHGRVLWKLKALDESIHLWHNQELHEVALKFLDLGTKEWHEEVLEEELAKISWVLNSFLSGILSNLCVIILELAVVREGLEDSVNNIVKLLELTTESAGELLSSFLVTSVDVEKLGAGSGVDNLSLIDDHFLDFISHLHLGLILSSRLSCFRTFGATLSLANTSHFKVLSVILNFVSTGLDGGSMSLLSAENTVLDKLGSDFSGISLITSESILLVHEPWKDIFVELAFELGLEHAHASQGVDGTLSKTNKVLLGDNARDVLLVSKFTLLLSSLLLVSTAFFLGINARFSGLESLCFDQLRVTDFFIF